MKYALTFLFTACLFVITPTVLQAQITITTDTVIQTSTCAGADLIIEYTVSGSLNAGNTFTAEMSNAFGLFSNPVVIGTKAGTTSGTMQAKIPDNATISILYRVRVVSDDPAVTGSNSPNTVVVTTIPALVFVTSDPGDSICQGDTTTLTGGLAVSYLWNTGDTTSSIDVTESGEYWVTQTDIAGCELNSDTALITVFPKPAPIISQFMDTLFSTPGSTHQWYFNDQPVSSANDPILVTSDQGVYYVEVTDENGCTGRSADHQWAFPGIRDIHRPLNFSVSPNPFDDILRINIAGSEPVQVHLYNSQGVLVSKPVVDPQGLLSFDRRALEPGLYLIRLTTSSGTGTRKVIKY